jgi:hypothetical protein
VTRNVRAFLFASLILAQLALASACGKDVDIGGSVDASLDDVPVNPAEFDAGPPLPCDPCQSPTACPANAACGRASDAALGYCFTLCPKGNECTSTESCTPTTTTSGAAAAACVPKSGVCPAAPPPPPQADGAPLERCGEIVGPPISAQCHACEKTSDCQANGCYGGWWCNTYTRDCQKPPTSCK